ncbi:hypothetical protein MMC30_007930 [Trapelia coarctata]|nr:hypothetical protein [Trapelia coarctata]
MDFQVKLLDFPQRTHYQFVSLKMKTPVNFNDMPIDKKYIQEALQSHRSTVSGVLDNCRVIGERAQWQLNAADSLINTWIAKQSQRTADESKNIVVETRRDSTSMKTIASLTMVYLPSTFVATIFSTGFFHAGDSVGMLTFIWMYLNKRGVPFFLRWTESEIPSQAGGKKHASPAAPILLNLPQQPGDKANHLVPEHRNVFNNDLPYSYANPVPAAEGRTGFSKNSIEDEVTETGQPTSSILFDMFQLEGSRLL